MSDIEHGPWVLVVDDHGQPTEVVRSREAEDALQYDGVRLVEVVPISQLQGAVEALRQARDLLTTADGNPRPGTALACARIDTELDRLGGQS